MKKIDYDGSKNIIGSRLETLRREKSLLEDFYKKLEEKG